MLTDIKAVIFDMDGVLIDSEPLWRRAMIKGFAEFGMPVTIEQCKQTMGMRITEVIAIWCSHFKITQIAIHTIEERIMELLLDLIKAEGRFIEGIPEIMRLCATHQIKMGLATSSSEKLMNAVLTKLDLHAVIDIKVSAEHLKYGKPHPEVFLLCAEKLEVRPQNCLVVEDSLNGVIAAKAAQMKVIAVPDDENTKNAQFVLADYKFETITESLTLVENLISSAGQSY